MALPPDGQYVVRTVRPQPVPQVRTHLHATGTLGCLPGAQHHPAGLGDQAPYKVGSGYHASPDVWDTTLRQPGPLDDPW